VPIAGSAGEGSALFFGFLDVLNAKMLNLQCEYHDFGGPAAQKSSSWVEFLECLHAHACRGAPDAVAMIKKSSLRTKNRHST
jgi:hypothetical protein